MSEDDLDVRQAVVLKPGDRVLVGVDYALSMENVARMKDGLTERFPGVEFSFIQGRVEAVMES